MTSMFFLVTISFPLAVIRQPLLNTRDNIYKLDSSFHIHSCFSVPLSFLNKDEGAVFFVSFLYNNVYNIWEIWGEVLKLC